MKLTKDGGLRVSEAQVQRACIELLRAEGWIVRPAARDGRKAARGAYSVPAGEPDLIALKAPADITDDGWSVLLIECKAAGGRLSEVQRAWAGVWGLPVWLVRSVEDLRAALREQRVEPRS